MEEKILEALKNPEVAKELNAAVSNAFVSTLKKAGVDCTADDVKGIMSAASDKISIQEMDKIAAAKEASCGAGAMITCTLFIVTAAADFV